MQSLAIQEHPSPRERHAPTRRARRGLVWTMPLLLLLCLWAMPSRLSAQIEGDTTSSETEEMYNEAGEYIGPDENGNPTDPGDGGDEEQPADSVKAKKVAEHTDFLDVNALMDGYPLRHEARYRPEDLLYTDQLDRESGFKVSLGQWGMPYQRYRYGTDAANLGTPHYVNLLTGAEDVYFIDPERGMRYFDTRTPYLNAYYGQGKADAAQMRVDVSQNVNPLLNIAALYHRRQCNGVYTAMVTDHNTVGGSANFHTLSERYQVYAHYLYQSHLDQVNGGVVPILPDSIFFDQSTQPVALADANLKRISSAVAYRQFYRILPDSLHGRHTLFAYQGTIRESLVNQFADMSVSTDVQDGFFPVLPSLGNEGYLVDRMRLTRTKADLGLSYRYGGPKLLSHQRLEVAQEFINFHRFIEDIPLRRTSILWKGDLSKEGKTSKLDLAGQYRQTFSNLFRPETYAQLDVAYWMGNNTLAYSEVVNRNPLNPADTVRESTYQRPFALTLHTTSYGRNPTLQMTQGRPYTGNLTAYNPNFSNRRINHLRFGAMLRGKDTWTSMGPQAGHRVELSAFTTSQAGIVYYSLADAAFTQASLAERVIYAGGELKLRTHLGKWFLESETVAQGFSSNSQRLTDQFLPSQPKFYTKTSIFYENYQLKFARLLRFGLDYWYFSTFDAPYYEASTQSFFPQGTTSQYFQFAYPRADVFASAQIKKAYLFVKVVNVLEALPQLGYFTTMGYPMQVRQVQLGVNWTFFD